MKQGTGYRVQGIGLTAVCALALLFSFAPTPVAAQAQKYCQCPGEMGVSGTQCTTDADCGTRACQPTGGGRCVGAGGSAGGGTTTGGGGGDTKLDNPLAGLCAGKEGQACVQTIIGNIIKAALGIVGSLALLMMVYGGFLWLTSAGNSERIQKGKEVLIWSTLGLVVIFGGYALTSFIISGIAGK